MSTRYYLSETQSFETDLTIQKYKSDHIMSAVVQSMHHSLNSDTTAHSIIVTNNFLGNTL